MKQEVLAECPICGGMEFGFVIESVAPGLYGMNPGGKVVSLDNTACMDPVFTCINCYAGLYQEAA